MKIFIDSANIADIEAAAALGFLEGCTTNPSLLAKSGRKVESAIPEICKLVNGPVSAEVISSDYEAMLSEGRSLAKLHEQVVVKLPLTVAGLRAVRALKIDGIRTNVTLCFSATQGLLAAKAGATFISPFLGRLDDLAQEGSELVRQLLKIYENYGLETQVLAASIRSPLHVAQAALLGAHCATMPLAVMRQLLTHPLTDVGLATFSADAKRAADKLV